MEGAGFEELRRGAGEQEVGQHSGLEEMRGEERRAERSGPGEQGATLMRPQHSKPSVAEGPEPEGVGRQQLEEEDVALPASTLDGMDARSDRATLQPLNKGSGLWQPVVRSSSKKAACLEDQELSPSAPSKSPSPTVPSPRAVVVEQPVELAAEGLGSEEFRHVASPPPIIGSEGLGADSIPPPRVPNPLGAAADKESGDEQSDSEASCRSTPPGDAMQDSINREASGQLPAERRAEPEDEGSSSSATSPQGAGAKRKRKDKSVSRLSFSDELDEDADSEVSAISKNKMSAATEKRFKLEERNRRRKEVGISSYTNGGFGSQHQDQGAKSPAGGRSTGMTVVDDDVSRSGPCLRLQHGVCGRQGKRPYMEDSYLATKNFMRKGYHLFGIFDGHGGSRASNFARDSIPQLLEHRLNADPLAEGKEVAQAISGAFTEVDKQFLEIARREQLKDGTTALLALLRHNTLHMGWVGDSRCILSREGKYVRVSEDHKPDRPDERKAVEARGGQVIFRGTFRVAGPTALAVSRAIGDILMKEPRKLVVADPEINTIDLHPKDEFLVMASDGLYDVMSDQNVIDAVSKFLTETKSAQGAAEKLTDLAIEKGSMDNVTVLVVQFSWGGCPDDDE